jgi:DDE domain/ATP-grasp domain
MSWTGSWAWGRIDVLLIEADGRALFTEHGIPVPTCVVVTDVVLDLPGDGPWIVKAQVPIGGRGKAGGVIRCESRPEVESAVSGLLGSRLEGHRVDACLVERVAVGQERYLAIMVDAISCGLRVIYSTQGGVEIEQSHSAQGRLCAPHPDAAAEALSDLIADEPQAWRDQVARIGEAKLTPALAEALRRRRRGKIGRSWYVDETYVKVQGRWCYLYRAIDTSGALVDVRLGETRDMAAATVFFDSAKTATGITPARVTTDGHDSYPRAIRTELGKAVRHRTNRYLNNRIETDCTCWREG